MLHYAYLLKLYKNLQDLSMFLIAVLMQYRIMGTPTMASTVRVSKVSKRICIVSCLCLPVSLCLTACQPQADLNVLIHKLVYYSE